MIDHGIWLLSGTAVALGFFYTLVGPDHYLPFIAVTRARHWPIRKTLAGAAILLSGLAVQFLGL